MFPSHSLWEVEPKVVSIIEHVFAAVFPSLLNESNLLSAVVEHLESHFLTRLARTSLEAYSALTTSSVDSVELFIVWPENSEVEVAPVEIILNRPQVQVLSLVFSEVDFECGSIEAIASAGAFLMDSE